MADVVVDESKLPLYTAAEVAAHNNKHDLWVIIDGKVYNLTPYVIPHPGGDAIAQHAGGDATEGFHGLQHPEHVQDTVKKYIIGRLAPAAPVPSTISPAAAPAPDAAPAVASTPAL